MGHPARNSLPTSWPARARIGGFAPSSRSAMKSSRSFRSRARRRRCSTRCGASSSAATFDAKLPFASVDAEPVVSIGAAGAGKRRSGFRGRGGLARRERGRRQAAAACRLSRSAAGPRRDLGADRAAAGAGARGLADAARRGETRRSGGRARRTHRFGRRRLAFGRVRKSASSTARQDGRAESGPATS